MVQPDRMNFFELNYLKTRCLKNEQNQEETTLHIHSEVDGTWTTWKTNCRQLLMNKGRNSNKK